MEHPTNKRRGTSTGRALRIAAYVFIAYLLLSMLGPVLQVVLLVFTGLLTAAALHAAGSAVTKLTRLPSKVALALVCVMLLGLLAAFIAIAAPSLAAEVGELRTALPQAIERMSSTLNERPWGRAVLGAIDEVDVAGLATMDGAAGAARAAIGGIGAGFLIVFVGLFVSFEPRVYKDALLRLAPVDRRSRYAEVLDASFETLRRWLLAKLAGMVVIGALTWLGLTLLGIPLAFVLAVVAGLLTFIPNIGPVLAAIPAVLLGFLDGPMTALAVTGMYLATQAVESYLITPLLQRKMMSLPPALTLAAQAVLAATSGAVGVVVATPLVAVVIVVVRMLYVEDHVESSSMSAPSAAPA